MSLHVATHVAAGQIAASTAAIRPASRKCVDSRRRTTAVTCSTSQRSEDGSSVSKNIAVAGMAALLFAGHPQMAMAKDTAIQGQGDLLTELLEKNGGKGVKVLKAPKRSDSSPIEVYKPQPKEAPKPAPIKAAATAIKKAAPAAAKKADPVSAVSEKLKFSDPVKTGTTGILPKGFEESALPLPKALQKAGAAAAGAAKSAASSVQSAAKAVTPAAPAPAPKEAVKKAFVNPLLQKRQNAPAAPVEAAKQALPALPNFFSNPLAEKKESPAAKPVEAAKKAFMNPLLQKREAAAAPKKEEVKNVLAPAAAAASAAAASAGAAIQKAVEPAVSSAPAVPAVPSLPSVSLPSFGASTSQDTTEALGVLAAEVVGAAIASSIVGGITAKVHLVKFRAQSLDAHLSS
ncbi:hypothetical protein WJX75_006618 [Coccomyxa subellipsoidea]|uniref:Uncharacterized protein n=1 Tax=Coccomyxa subellipsoidea TaxID=248742 RepID=A0ABR2Z217_9CHLO